MANEQLEQKDKWEEALEIKLTELKKCQESNNLHSCFPCDQLLKCQLRSEYVKAVYESMNKGQGGGFEF